MIEPIQSAIQVALNGLATRQHASADNVANIQTSGYLAKQVNFEDKLQAALNGESKNVSPGDITVISRAGWKDGRLTIDSTSESTEGGKLVTVKTTRVLWIDKAGDLIVERTGTPASVVTSSSICAGEMISGGDSAMVSPVVRISRPFSKAFTNAS